MSSIWNKFVVLGLAAALSSPVFAADDAAAKAPDQMQAGAAASQTGSAAMPSDAAEGKKEEAKEEAKEEGKKAAHKHKATRHHHKAKKEAMMDGSTDANKAADGSANADAAGSVMAK